MSAPSIALALVLAAGFLGAQAPSGACASPVPAVMISHDTPSLDPDGAMVTTTDWSALADSLRDVGRHREAIAAYERAMQLGSVEPARAAFNVARAYAHLDNRRQALRWLEHARTLGLTDAAAVRGEPEFARYRDDAGFQAIVDRVAKSRRWRAA